jgi:uncharacterized membrane protein
MRTSEPVRGISLPRESVGQEAQPRQKLLAIWHLSTPSGEGVVQININHPSKGESGINAILARNIETLLEKRRREERRASTQQKVADAITRFAGSIPFVYIHAAVFGLWGIVNLGWVGLRPFDPSFVVLAMLASVEAIFLSTFILISQNRMSAIAETRADLDLHISLLSEHEITRLLQLVSRIAENLNIAEGSAPDLVDLKQDVAPEKVLDKIEEEAIAQARGDRNQEVG